jgi:hypothetical protein
MGAALSCGGGARSLLKSVGDGDAETVREVCIHTGDFYKHSVIVIVKKSLSRWSEVIVITVSLLLIRIRPRLYMFRYLWLCANFALRRVSFVHARPAALDRFLVY